MLLASNVAGIKRGLPHAVVIALAGLLPGCPQLLSDDFQITDASSGAAGLRSANDRNNSTTGAGGSQATLATSLSIEGGTGAGPVAEMGGSREQSSDAETSSGGHVANDTSTVNASIGQETLAAGGRTVRDTFASGGAFGTERTEGSGGIRTIRSVGSAGRPYPLDGTDANEGVTSGVSTSMGGMAGSDATGGRQAMVGAGFNSGWWQNRAGSASRAGATASTMPGTGGAPTIEISDCSNMVVLDDPVVATFDNWNGITEPHKWRFPFNGSTTSKPVTATFERYEDGTGDYTLTFVPGAMNTSYAVRAHNPSASNWGGGVKLALHCFDASSFHGVSFWIRGTTPAGTAVVTLSVDGTNADVQFDVPAQWQQIRLDLSKFSGWGVNRPGRGIFYIVFSSQLRYIGTLAQPGIIEIVVDEIGFY